MTSYRPIHIALTFNDYYWALAFATMRSICLSTRLRKDLVFHLVHPEITAEHRNFLDAIPVEFPGAQVLHHDPMQNADFVASIQRLPHGKRFPPIVYARLFLDQLLPPDVDRVLYLDVDILLRRPIEQLYDTDLKDKDLAAVTDPFHDIIKKGHDMNTKPSPFDTADPYFNAGMFVANRAALKRANVPAQITDLEQRGMLDKLYYDQDLMNLIFLDRWLELDWSWNLVNPRRDHETLGPKLIHYTTKKPWFLFSGGAYERVYRNTMSNKVYYTFMRERWKKKFWLRPFVNFYEARRRNG